MANLSDDRPISEQQKEIEQRIKNLMGTPPQDPNKQEPQKQTERLLVIDKTNLPKNVPPPAPPAISPATRPPEKRALPKQKPKKTIGHKIKRFFRKWWGDPSYRWTTIIVVTIAVLLSVIVPYSRYFMLNAIGVRSKASLTVLDATNSQPLKNAQVEIDGNKGQTNENGFVELNHIKLGRTKLIIQKRAFATSEKQLTIGWGSNPLGEHTVNATGAQFTFEIRDWLSGKPIQKAEAETGVYSAFSDEQGKLVLTIDTEDLIDNMPLTFTAQNYRSETIDFATNIDTPDNIIKLVTAKKAVFVDKREGLHNLYTIDIDGQNENLILNGSGVERDDMVLLPHPENDLAALVSTRVNVRNSDGYLLSTLTIVNIADSSTYQAAQSERIEIIGWIGDRLVLVQIKAGASATDADRFKLISYEHKTTDKKELASANSFNDITIFGNNIYYAPSSTLQKKTNPGLIKINADGSQKTVLLDKEVNNIFRTEFDVLTLAAGKEWYQYKLGNSNPVKFNQQPQSTENRVYISNQDFSYNIWVDNSGPARQLNNYDISKSEDINLSDGEGASYPIYWLTDEIFAYRVNKNGDSADYAMSISGGEPVKVADVWSTTGVDKWYFYR